MSSSSTRGSDRHGVSTVKNETATSSLPSHVSVPGELGPVLTGPGSGSEPRRSHAATAASAASVRALTSQAVAFYFRAPVKAFFRTRVDYLAYARALQEQQDALARAAAAVATVSASGAPSSGSIPSSSAFSSSSSSRLHWLRQRLRSTTPGVLTSAVRHFGWRVVPDQVLPPLVANVGVGAVLYTSYLQILARLHPESALPTRRVYPPPGPGDTFVAGLLAGAVQSVAAAPLDAVQARYDLGRSAAGMTGSGNPSLLVQAERAAAAATNTVTSAGAGSSGKIVGRPQSMWAFSFAKLREIGARGIFAGWGLSLVKDGLGCAIFFSTFEWVKAQGYYGFLTWAYGSLSEDMVALLSRKSPEPRGMPTVIRPHYAIEPAFLMLAGVGASVAQQVVIHPLSHIQVEHWERLEALDEHARVRRERQQQQQHQQQQQQLQQRTQTARTGGSTLTGTAAGTAPQRWHMTRLYYHAYQTTWRECRAEARAAGLGMRQWLYRGFWWNALRQVPGTSAGLIIFELIRRKYGMAGDEVKISRDGYDILLA